MKTYADTATKYECMADEEVVTMAQCGTSEAAESLIDRYRMLVESKARTYFLVGAEHDDVVQEGMIGLCKAIRDFREDRLNKFRPFAELCVTRQIITAVKTATRHKHAPLNASVSLNQTLSPEHGDCALIDLVPDERPTPDQEPQEDALPQNFTEMIDSTLSELEKCVLSRYLDGQSYREMSLDLNCHTKSIDNALQRVKKKIGTLLQNSA
ncbi:MAG: RNA polymerase sporulation sigma factor SigH [Fimbriimonadaceae bacterium]